MNLWLCFHLNSTKTWWNIEDVEDRLAIAERLNEPDVSKQDFDKLFNSVNPHLDFGFWALGFIWVLDFEFWILFSFG